MGREVRMVPPGWQHPKVWNGFSGTMEYRGLMAGPYSKRAAEWDLGAAKWKEGLREVWRPNQPSEWEPIPAHDLEVTFEEWDGPRPQAVDYMPEWEPGQANMLMMYENTSEGTPISPAFDTPEELARWLADNGASAFGASTATYEEWLATCKSGYAVSMVVSGGVMQSGVAANLPATDTVQTALSKLTPEEIDALREAFRLT